MANRCRSSEQAPSTSIWLESLFGYDGSNGSVVTVIPLGVSRCDPTTSIFATIMVSVPIDDLEQSLGYKVDSLVQILIEFVVDELKHMFEILENINILLTYANLVPNNPPFRRINVFAGFGLLSPPLV